MKVILELYCKALVRFENNLKLGTGMHGITKLSPHALPLIFFFFSMKNV